MDERKPFDYVQGRPVFYGAELYHCGGKIVYVIGTRFDGTLEIRCDGIESTCDVRHVMWKPKANIINDLWD